MVLKEEEGEEEEEEGEEEEGEEEEEGFSDFISQEMTLAVL